MSNSEDKQNLLLFCSWMVAVIATAGSLFFSEVIGFIPCELCWYQRIFMYPLTILLAIAVIKKDMNFVLPTLILSLVGAAIAFYHYLLQKVPAMAKVDSCGIIPCSGQYINWLGFITIPFLSLIAFVIIILICIKLLQLMKR